MRNGYMHRPGAAIEELAAEIHPQVWINGAKAAIIDFYQLIGGRARNERDDAHMARVAQMLQRVAVEPGIPLVVFVQLDEMGYLTMNREAMRQASNTYLVLHRDPHDPRAFLETQANNVGEGHHIGSPNQQSLHLEYDEGPHFLDAHAVSP